MNIKYSPCCEVEEKEVLVMVGVKVELPILALRSAPISSWGRYLGLPRVPEAEGKRLSLEAKIIVLEDPSIDPGTSRMLSRRSTI